MKISNLELKVVRFGNEDVIATSLFYTSAADYNALYGTNFTTQHVEFNGTISTFDPEQNAWLITDMSPADDSYGQIDDDIEFAPTLISWGPAWGAYELFGSTYDAYQYNGNYYTKGATYMELYGNQ